MNILKFLVVFLVQLQFAVNTFEVKRGKCTSTNNTIIEFEVCEVVNGTFPFTLNIKFPVHKMNVSGSLIYFTLNCIFNLQIEFIILYKEGENFRQFFKSPVIDWCEIMAGGKTSNSITRAMVKTLRTYIKSMIQKCPYKGRYDSNPVRKAEGIFAIIPKGTINIVFKATNSDLTITVDMLIEFQN